jgi:hypothetical protein
VSPEKLLRFVRESNAIEGILRPPTRTELDAHAAFLPLRTVTVADVESFVAHVADRPLRRERGQDVHVGSHRPPPGGEAIERQLSAILADAHTGHVTPYEVHVAYETLHPFMDGNGRSGRVLWAWQMLRDGQDPFALAFLHRFYYQALDGERGSA